MSNATNSLLNELQGLFMQETKDVTAENINKFEFCMWNLTAATCPTSFNSLKSDKPILLTVYNPGFLNQFQNFRINIPNVLVNVYDADNKALMADIFCLNNTDANDCQLYFGADLIGYQVNYFKIVPIQASETTKLIRPHVPENKLKYTLKVSDGKYLKTEIIANKPVFTYQDCDSENCGFKATYTINYNYYKSYQGDGQRSGAYIFRPDNNDTFNHSIPYSPIDKKTTYQGSVVLIQHLEGAYIDTQVKYYVQYAQTEYVEIESYIKSIPIEDKIGKEVLMIIQTGIENKGIFYTDSNGLEMQRRKLNYRSTWDLEVHQPAAGNYYPINAAIQIEDQTLQVTLLNDRAQGGTSLADGQIEMMIHRRCLMDDGRGVGEPLNETNQWNANGLEQRVRHYLSFNNPQSFSFRKLQQEFDQYPVILFSETNSTRFALNNQKQPLVDTSFPQNVKVYVRYIKDKDSYIVRFQNMDEKRTVYVNLGQVGFIGNPADEMTLTANQKIDDWQKRKIQWKTGYPQELNDIDELIEDFSGPNADIMLRPLQLRTYMVKAKKLKTNIEI